MIHQLQHICRSAYKEHSIYIWINSGENRNVILAKVTWIITRTNLLSGVINWMYFLIIYFIILIHFPNDKQNQEENTAIAPESWRPISQCANWKKYDHRHLMLCGVFDYPRFIKKVKKQYKHWVEWYCAFFNCLNQPFAYFNKVCF